jgi:hypothetical protein
MVCNENILHYILRQHLIGPLLVEQPTLGIDELFHKCELSFLKPHCICESKKPKNQVITSSINLQAILYLIIYNQPNYIRDD